MFHFIEQLFIISKKQTIKLGPEKSNPFYDLLHENTPWKWTEEHETLFQQLKMLLTAETQLTIPNTKQPFFITVDASLIGLGAVLFQLN